MNNFLCHATAVICMTLLTSCSGVNLSQWHFPYMMQVQQGVYITNDQYQQLKVGMTKDQASFIIGHPINQYIFNNNRWDFIYQNYTNNTLKKSYTVTLIFDQKNILTNISKTGQLFDK